MVGRVASLNASVAGSILLFEVLGQRPQGTAQSVPPSSSAAPLLGGEEEASK
jgi:hypothetical protein